MQMVFRAIDEPLPGSESAKWVARNRDATLAWYKEAIDGGYELPTPVQCRQRLAASMPELLGGYDAACELASDDPVMQAALAEVDPPPLIPFGCTVRALGVPALVRNYDFHPEATSGVIVRSHWNTRTVLGTGEGIIGLLDGVNDSGLAGAITFGGRHVYGKGFGVLLILRWVLEVASNVQEASEAILSVPCAWSQNLLFVDRSGRSVIVSMSPDRGNKIEQARAVTNHQSDHESTEGSRNRLACAIDLADDDIQAALRAFHKPPIFGTDSEDWMMTLYTAVYAPSAGTVEYLWPDQPAWRQGIADFESGERVVDLPENQ